MSRPSPRALYAVFFVGGMPALMYQVVWQRVLTLYFGVDIYSTSVTISTFMLGLGLGSLAGGRLADRTDRPGRWYAFCEIGTALFGAASLAVFASVGQALAGSSLAVIIPVDFALLLIPTTMMGMTLPLMVRTAQTYTADVGSHLSWLYGLNTLGAALGALVTGWWLVGAIGFVGTTYVAAAANLALGVIMFALSSRPAAARAEEASEAEEGGATSGPPDPLSLILSLSFLSGVVALGYEVVWYRLLTILLHGTPYVFGTILTVFLASMALGSIRARRRIDAPHPLQRFAWAQLGMAAYVFAIFTVLGHASWLPGLKHLISASMFTSFHPSLPLANGKLDLVNLYSLLDIAFWAALLIYVPAFLMGYGFPNLMRAASRSLGAVGRSVGYVYFANIVGSTSGSLVAGFVLIHYLGSERTLASFILLGSLTGLMVLWPRRDDLARRQKTFMYGGAGLLLLTVVAFPGEADLLRAFHLADFDVVEFTGKEDRTGVVVMRKQNAIIAFGQEKRIVGEKRIYIDGARHGRFGANEQDDVQDDVGVRLTLSAANHPRRVLSVGLGDGRMVATALRWPTVEEVVVVELNGALREVLSQTVQGKFITDSPKLRYIVDDGRRWLLANPDEKFDVIIEFPLAAAHAFSGNLYSEEFFTIVRGHLDEDGVFMTRTSDAFATARTLSLVFEGLVRARAHSYIAAQHPLRFDVSTLGWSKAQLMENLEADRETIVAHTADAPINRDFAPNSEYYMTYSHSAGLSGHDAYRTEPAERLSAFIGERQP